MLVFHCVLCIHIQRIFIAKESIVCDPCYLHNSHGGYLRYSPIGSYPNMTLYFISVGVMDQEPNYFIFYDYLDLFYYYFQAPDRNK